MDKYDTYKMYIAFPHGDNAVIKEEICSRLIELGWDPPFDGVADGTTINVHDGMFYRTSALTAENGNESHSVGSLYKLFNTEFYRRERSFQKEVALNDKYNATITDSVVKVGCQEFSFDVIEDLYEAVQEAKKNSQKG